MMHYRPAGGARVLLLLRVTVFPGRRGARPVVFFHPNAPNAHWYIGMNKKAAANKQRAKKSTQAAAPLEEEAGVVQALRSAWLCACISVAAPNNAL